MDFLDGEDSICCRICRLPASPGNSLFSPCKCSGSIKYVHQGCLISWLNHSGHQHCELCRHKIKFRPVYAPEAPSRLPWTELIWGLAVKSVHSLALGTRVLLVVITWLFIVPLLTCWMWRLAFLTSLSQGVENLAERLQPVLILADCVQGSLISSALIFMVLFTTYTADHIRAYWQIMQPPPPPPQETAADLLAHPVEQDPVNDWSMQGEGPSQEDDFSGLRSPRATSLSESDDDTEPQSSGSIHAQESSTNSDTSWHSLRGPPQNRDEGASSSGGGPQRRNRRRNAQTPEPQQPPPVDRAAQPQAPPPPQDVPPVFHNPPADEREAPEQAQDREFPFNELIGLEGPFRVLLENAATVIFTTWAFMTAALWMPFMLGRIVIPTVLDLKHTIAGTAATLPPARASPDSFWAPQQGSAGGLFPGAAGPLAQNATLDGELWEGVGSKLALLPLLNRLAAEFEAHLSGPALSDWACLCAGYALLVMLAMLAFWSLVVWKLLWRSTGLRGQRNILRAAFADISHQTRVHLGYAAVMIKVSLVLTLELTLLPALHGCWVDLCLLPLFGSAWSDRMLWFQASPISFLLVHWVAGMAFLMGMATFLSILRQQLRPGALPFFKDPYEGDEEPMRALMVLGLGHQLEREVCALSALACLSVILLHLPLRLTRVAIPNMLPLQINMASPYAAAPTDLLLFHFLLPLTVPRLQVRHLIQQGIRFWLKVVTKWFQLDDYLLPRRAGEGNAAADAQQQPVFIPQGMPDLVEDSRVAAWNAELDAARQRTGPLVGLLVALLGSFVLLNTALLNVPLLLGRSVLWVAQMPPQHDLYNLAVGAYTTWGLALISKQLYKVAGATSVSAAAAVARQWLVVVMRLSAMAVVGLGVLPALIGLFLELTVLPLRLRPEEIPSFFLYQDWAIGLLALKMGFRCLLGWPQANNNPVPPAEPSQEALDEPAILQPLKRLQANVRRLKAAGLTRIGFADAFGNVLWPLLMFWGTAIGAPYVLSRGLAPRLALVDARVLHTIFAFGWLFEGALFIGCISFVKVLTALERLASKLRDQRYLLHRELINVSE